LGAIQAFTVWPCIESAASIITPALRSTSSHALNFTLRLMTFSLGGNYT
jgi:hypothetical protein